MVKEGIRMKLSEWMEKNGVKDENEIPNIMSRNLHEGKLPVAIAVCPDCQEMLVDYSKPCPCKDE